MSSSPDPKSNFLTYLVEHNRPRMEGFAGWRFQPGMLFKAPTKWWGDQGPRYTRHEGLDLHSYADADGTIKTVDQYTLIPAAFAGEIVKIGPDFLGQSIYISHAILSGGGGRLLSAYGHTVPRESLAAGDQVAAGEIIARVSTFPDKKTSLPPHLHLTFAWVPVQVTPQQLDWKNLGADPEITLIDPLSVLSGVI